MLILQSPPTMPRLLLLLGLAGLSASGLWAQASVDVPLGVTGTLVDERGAPVPSAEVVLRPYPSGLRDRPRPARLRRPAASRGPRANGTGRQASRSRRWPPAPTAWRSGSRRRPPRRRPSCPSSTQTSHPWRHRGFFRYMNCPIDVSWPPGFSTPTIDRSKGVGGRESYAVQVSPSGTVGLRRGARAALPRFQRASARTDAHGVARFLMPTAEANVVVSATGFRVENGGTESGRATFVLTPDPGMRFRVRGPDGAPAAGVLLRITGKARAPLALTDEQGEVTAGKVADTGIAFELLRWDGAFTRTSQPDTAAAGSAAADAPSILGWKLRSAFRVGSSTRVSGFPVANAAIWGRGRPRRERVERPHRRVPGWNPGPEENRRRLWVQAEGYVATGVSAPIPEYGVTDETAVALRPAAPLYGFVTDSAGQPVAGADISGSAPSHGIDHRHDRQHSAGRDLGGRTVHSEWPASFTATRTGSRSEPRDSPVPPSSCHPTSPARPPVRSGSG